MRNERPQPARDDKAIASWNGLALAALAECGRVLDRADWIDAARGSREFLLGPLSTARAAAPHLARRRREGHRLPRRLRERRQRPLRAARRDGRAALARGVEPPRAARGRAVRRRRERRLLRDAVRRRAARRPQEGLRRPPGAERQRDARLRAAAARADLRRRRAGGARGVVLQADPARADAGAVGVRLGARRVRPVGRRRAREIAIVGAARLRGRARRGDARWDPKAVVAFGPADDVPLLEGKTLVDGKPAVYVCERFACQAPVTDPAALAPV